MFLTQHISLVRFQLCLPKFPGMGVKSGTDSQSEDSNCSVKKSAIFISSPE